MNNQRRKEIKKIIEKMYDIKTEIESVLSDEEFSFDNMPEGLQNSERGMNSEEAIDLLNEAIDNIEGSIENLEDII